MLANSSFALTSPTGMILTPSGSPFGMLINIFRKLPSPLDWAIFSLISFSISSVRFGSLV
ncbi:hypothetical protein BX29_04985 [Escherichia coli O45:H2 str. 2009C-4780]|nr:hypothetical protein BX56_20405 [Escherichia coli O45:H2 str. 2010C-3876]EZE72281.1 hypothetical protein BX29_04985 [Escherichia coli O45:H2 str. 2009C-4780]KDM86941.1 hypothetical protein DC22_11175 [Escherichia coli]OXY00329.1 hypothetical protein P700_09230 [Salmonella enterica subsp. enterica serovar Newport str. CVM75_1280]